MLSQVPAITFFDIATKARKGWSAKALRTEYCLNYKQIPHTTVYLSYPDISPTLGALGAPEHDPPFPFRRTCPAIAHEGVLPFPMQESFDIALHLDKHFPERPLFPTAGSRALALLVTEYLEGVCFTLAGAVAMPLVPPLLDEKAVPYFYSSREAMFGMTLEEFGNLADWDSFVPSMKVFERMLQQEADGPYFLGALPSYADFVLSGFLEFCKAIDPTPGKTMLFKRVLALSKGGEFERLHNATSQWVHVGEKEQVQEAAVEAEIPIKVVKPEESVFDNTKLVMTQIEVTQVEIAAA